MITPTQNRVCEVIPPDEAILSAISQNNYLAARRMFQTLDGCLHLSGCTMLVRQDYAIAWEDFQVLPAQLRGRENSAEYFGVMQSVFYRD